jgi:hypothetical protein
MLIRQWQNIFSEGVLYSWDRNGERLAKLFINLDTLLVLSSNMSKDFV